ncbi:MAG: hypothetical protein Q4Q58_00730 [Thermoplasmata archaeon]|nr:hypothetical protein [Thermoplasmata archaeon]
MSFTDNQKVVGWAFFIIGFLMVIAALLQLVDGFTLDGGLGEHAGYIIAAIGALIAAVLYFLFGNKVRTGALSGKLNILGSYVNIVGVTTVVIGIFAAIGGIMSDISFWDNVVAIILGLIVIWAASKIADGKTTTMDKILWIILTVVFLVLFVVSFLGLFSLEGEGITLVVNILTSICYAIVYLFMLCYMFDNDVKKGMGM